MLERLVKIFTSLKLTVVLLGLGLVLVFWGTMAQVHLGLYKAQNEFFRSFFVYWHPAGADFGIPIFPGGYMLGGLLILNLLAAHTRYYQPGKKKIGIVMIHLGVVMLLVGQLLTDVLANESMMHIREGQTKNYSESIRKYELAVIDTTDPELNTVVAIPGHRLARLGEITNTNLPFTIRVKAYYANSSVAQTNEPGYEEIKTSAGMGSGFWWRSLPNETRTDRRDMPSGIVELTAPKGSLGNLFISSFLARPQEFTYAGHHYQMTLRPQRYYKPYSLHLIRFRFDRYPGTQIPKNFSSRVRLQNVETGEDREVLIYMNHPLRYDGETLYQADWDHADEKGTILQVVRNPSWLTPYLACVIVAAGLLVQFLTHLFRFATKRRTA